MTIFRYVFLSICAVAELLLFLFGLTGFSVGESAPLGMVLAITVGAAVMLLITLVSFYKVSKGSKFPVLQGFLLKLSVLIMALGISWFALDIPEAGWVGVIVSIPLAALSLLLPRLSEANSEKKNVIRPAEIPAFDKDKAEWAFDDAAAEYLRLHGEGIRLDTQEGKKAFADRIASMSESEVGAIYDYAGTPAAYFLGWLIRRELVSDEYLAIHGTGESQALASGSMTPIEIFRNMDYVLTREDIKLGARSFVDQYYRYEKGIMPFSHSTHRYFFDYYRVFCSGSDVPRYYCVDFDRKGFEELMGILDRRYRDYNDCILDEEEMVPDDRKLKCRYFDTEAELWHEPGTPADYVQMCADSFENMGDHLCRDMSEFLVEYCTEELSDEELHPENVIRKFEPSKVVVLKPETSIMRQDAASVPAYVILGGSEWEEEHGISFTVIGEYATGCAYYADVQSPWEEDMQWNYMIRRDRENERLCAVSVIPERFGGSSAADNQVTVPVAAARRKNEADIMVEALFTLGQVQKYDCKFTYHEGKPNYLLMVARNGQETVFADSVRLL